MDKNKIVCIGAGGAGGKLLDTLMNIDARYTPVFFNTNLSEMEVLENYDAKTNALYVAGASGSGRDSKLAKELIKKDQARLTNYFQSKFSESSGVETFYIMASGDGGSGSGSVSILTQVIKKRVNPRATVNLLIAAPKLSEKELSLKNFKRLWVDIKNLVDNKLVNSIQFIDNNKMYDEEEFNYEVMKEFDSGLSINSIEIDHQDSARVNNAKGYKVTLDINSKYKPLKLAIDKAIESSNFILPDTLECEYLLASFAEDGFDKDKVEDMFTVYGMAKTDYNDDEYEKNIVVLGGCQMPNSYMELIIAAEEELKAEKAERDKKTGGFLNISLDEDEEEKFTETNITKEKTSGRSRRRKVSTKAFMEMMQEDLW